MRLYCDRCLTPFNEADCWPDITPPGEDWSEFCPSCREWKPKFYLKHKDKEKLIASGLTSALTRPPDSPLNCRCDRGYFDRRLSRRRSARLASLNWHSAANPYISAQWQHGQ